MLTICPIPGAIFTSSTFFPIGLASLYGNIWNERICRNNFMLLWLYTLTEFNGIKLQFVVMQQVILMKITRTERSVTNSFFFRIISETSLRKWVRLLCLKGLAANRNSIYWSITKIVFLVTAIRTCFLFCLKYLMVIIFGLNLKKTESCYSAGIYLFKITLNIFNTLF